MKPGKTILGTTPYFLVRDIHTAAAFYRDVLGFNADHIWGEPPCFCMPQRDGHVFMLRQANDPKAVRPNGEVDADTWDAYVDVADAEALFQEFKARGAKVVYPPKIQEYSKKEFAIKDLDGYVLAFGQDWS